MRALFFHRNLAAGYSINKVTQTIVRQIPDKEEFYVPYAGASLKSILGNLIFVFKHRNRKAINHITGDIHYCILALIGCKSVLTIHDTVALDFNELSKLKKFLIEWLWFRLPLLLATKVVCISEQTRQCVKRLTNRKDIVVIHNAIDPLFKPFPPHQHRDIPSILLIGTNPNKNLLRTIEALQGVKCKVSIIGKLSKEQLAALDRYHICYENRQNLSDEQILEEYVKCDVVSFISLFEGFGMIVIEANKVGRPVVCSDIPVLKEIGGDAALFVNPYHVEEIRNAFSQLLYDDILYKDYVIKGEMNVQRFDSSFIASQWIKFYESIH
jgi:glycosyltransferase involved in cell wall biosynthesis